MHRSMIRTSVVALATTALLLSVGGGALSAADEQPTTLTMWVHTDPNYVEIAEAQAAAYHEATGNTIELTYVPWDQYGAKILSAFVAGTEPDIIQGVASWLYTQKLNGQLSEVPADFASTLSDTNPASLAPVTYEGKYFGVPLNVNIDSGPQLLYSVAAMDAAGVTPDWQTWDDFTAALQKMTVSRNGKITQSGIEMMGGDLVIQFLQYFLRSGGEFYTPDLTGVQIANEHGEAALQIMHDLLYKYQVDSTELADWEGIAVGTAASILFGPWYTAVLNADFPDFQWAWATLPPSPGQVSESWPGTNVWAWMVPSTSPNATAAWDYIRWMNEPEQRMAWALKTGEIPALESMWTDSQIASDPRWAPWFPVLKDQVPLLYIGPQDPQYKVLQDMITGVMLNTVEPAAALQTAQDALNKIVAG
jgi:multiple sugar transport system substrate-binding protein